MTMMLIKVQHWRPNCSSSLK